jgi:hypothetical protein
VLWIRLPDYNISHQAKEHEKWISVAELSRFRQFIASHRRRRTSAVAVGVTDVAWAVVDANDRRKDVVVDLLLEVLVETIVLFQTGEFDI